MTIKIPSVPSADLDLKAEIERLRAENARLSANRREPKKEPATINYETGVVHFPGVAGLFGLSLNPDALQSMVDRLPALLAEFKANEAKIRAAYDSLEQVKIRNTRNQAAAAKRARR